MWLPNKSEKNSKVTNAVNTEPKKTNNGGIPMKRKLAKVVGTASTLLLLGSGVPSPHSYAF